MTIDQFQEMLYNIYERRNCVFMANGLFGRIMFLNLAIGDLQEAIRKESSQEIITAALARIIARIFCIANYFFDLQLSKAMMQKYPDEYCSYCQKKPCECPERRPEPMIRQTVSLFQKNWRLKEWCEHFDSLYGKKNRKRGIDYIVNRLSKEISELISLCMGIPKTEDAVEIIEQEFAFELSDAIAWTIAVANYFEIDLEDAVRMRYNKRCHACLQTICRCTHFDIHPKKWIS